MPCSPLTDSNFQPPSGTSPGIGVQQNPLDGIAGLLNGLSKSIPAPDLAELFSKLGFTLPTGIYNPDFEPKALNDIYAGINSILQKVMPFLMMYKFFIPMLNLILCIIEVICSLANPFSLIGAVIKLFTQCIPAFLALFPFFAFIAIIISLLILILTIVNYIISIVLSIIANIIALIESLLLAVERLIEDAIKSIIEAIGEILCFLSNLFVIFNAILSIIEIIKGMLSLGFDIPPCSGSGGSNSPCCTPDVCPAFIKNNDTILGINAHLQYYSEVGLDSGLSTSPGYPKIIYPLRPESWQFYDPNLSKETAFINITNAYDLPAGTSKVFFPPGASYTDTTHVASVPYTISFRFYYDPAVLGKIDPKGARFIRINNAIIASPPTYGVYNGQTYSPVDNGTGVLNLIGGAVLEDDGTQIFDSNGQIMYLTSFIHVEPSVGTISSPGILFSQISYEFTINHEPLVAATLITVGCVPEVAIARDFINLTIGNQFTGNQQKLTGPNGVVSLLPDVAAAQTCIFSVINQYTQSISVESTQTLQTNLLDCLNTLAAQTTTALIAAINAGVDVYKSDFSVNPSIQFTTKPITVSVSLNESSGQNIVKNVPADAATKLAPQITAVATLGQVSNFVYDGYEFFTADIASEIAGNGTISIMFDGNYISTLINPADPTQPRSVAIKEVSYTFVESPVFSSGISSDSGQPRRDVSDTSADNDIDGS
jgi:hypothetical protein